MADAVNPITETEATAPAVAAPRQETYQYAGFWVRVGAFTIDSIIMYIAIFTVAFALGVVMGIFGAVAGWNDDMVEGAATLLGFISAYAVAVAYQAVFLTGSWQATPGKRLCGIYVIREGGGKLTAGRAIGRYFAYMVSSFTLCVGYAMAGWTDQKKSLHDIICETRVVHGKP